eukprot:GHVT01049017.1.p1 GENE.GHVT01049017.1~~GHVT01049017.1.p1  ORF type:complete len:162 (+),score=2.06 GHVT01049017.1:653-1138(+)
MRSANKANLLTCLETEETTRRNAPCIDAKVFDGAAVVQMLAPKTAKTFQEYDCGTNFYSLHHKTSPRYQPTRFSSGCIFERQFENMYQRKTRNRYKTKSVRISTDTKELLREDEKKTELFAYLSQVIQHIMMADLDKVVYATNGEAFCAPSTADLPMVALC